MINSVVLVGRLTKDPELRYSSSNIPMVSFTIAVNRTFADQNGNRNADFIRCVVFRKPAENMARYLSKGSLIGVTGRIQTGSYQGKDGNTVYTTDVMVDNVQFLESKGAANRNADNGFASMSFNQPSNSGYSNNQYSNNSFSNDDFSNNFSNNFSTNNQSNASMHQFMNETSELSSLGADFPSSLDVDFAAGLAEDNPFSLDK